MANLNGENYTRVTPTFTHEQLEGIRRLRGLSYKTFFSVMRDHGEWKDELQSLNKATLDDILYTVATGEYELIVDPYEDYLIGRVRHFEDHYNKSKHNVHLSGLLVASDVLTKYRTFIENGEE